jgi:hypothetical protein
MISWLFSIALIFIFSLPALLVVFLYQRWVPPASQTGHSPARMRYLLYAIALLSLLFALIVFVTSDTGAGPTVLALLPALEGLLAVVLINLPSLATAWQADRKPVILALVSFLIALLATAFSPAPSLVLLLVLPPILIALLWVLGQRINLFWAVLLSITLVVILVFDALGIAASHAVFANPTLRNAYKLISGLSTILALGLAAVFVYQYFKPGEEGPPPTRLYLVLAGLLVLGVGAATMRHGVLTRATGRAFEDHLPFAALAIPLFAGLVLALSLNGRGRRAGLAFIGLAFVILFFYSLGWQIDPEAVTAARLRTLEGAIQQYRQDTGVFPASLADLTPTPLPLILGPLTGRGQTWCYQSGAGFYRLGYVYFQRYHKYPDDTPFWEPYYSIETPAAAGPLPPGEWICDEELRLFKTHHGL